METLCESASTFGKIGMFLPHNPSVSLTAASSLYTREPQVVPFSQMISRGSYMTRPSSR